MAVVFMLSKDGETLIALDATTSVNRTRTGSVTQNTVQTGATISDHYHSTLPAVTFSGVITDSKIRDENPAVGELVYLVDELMDSGETFTLYGTGGISGYEDIPTMSDCVITSFSALRDTQHANSLEVVISVQQVDISNSATADAITLPSVNTQGQLDATSDTGVGSKTEIDRSKYTQLELQVRGENPSILDIFSGG